MVVAVDYSKEIQLPDGFVVYRDHPNKGVVTVCLGDYEIFPCKENLRGGLITLQRKVNGDIHNLMNFDIRLAKEVAKKLNSGEIKLEKWSFPIVVTGTTLKSGEEFYFPWMYLRKDVHGKRKVIIGKKSMSRRYAGKCYLLILNETKRNNRLRKNIE